MVVLVIDDLTDVVDLFFALINKLLLGDEYS